MKRFLAGAVWTLALAFGLASHSAFAQEEKYITLASTTSTENSGLFGHILPLFTQASGIEVRVVARGTGQALQMARDGDADVLLVHDKDGELKLVEEGFAVERRDVMYNDYVVVGPSEDPAGIRGLGDVVAGFKKIAETGSTFVSRGDDSGTHRAELRFWQEAGVDARAASGTWYLEAGAGMGATLNIAAAKPAYTLSDRGTWLSFENRADLELLLAGDPRLFNQYGAMLVNPERHPHVKKDWGMAFLDWITSPEGQEAIASFTIGGEQLFFPNAGG
jgi:tungstate transport system substrate-binding protein